jgi:hypothetical protein
MDGKARGAVRRCQFLARGEFNLEAEVTRAAEVVASSLWLDLIRPQAGRYTNSIVLSGTKIFPFIITSHFVAG